MNNPSTRGSGNPRGGRGRGGDSGGISSCSTRASVPANVASNTSLEVAHGDTFPIPRAEPMSYCDEKPRVALFVKPDEMVTFLVGPEKKKFLIHKEFVTRHSPVLNAAFKSEFEEGRTQTYTLEDVTPRVFQLFSEFMYSERLTLTYHNIGEGCIAARVDHYGECNRQDLALLNLWILADKLLIPKLQNHIIKYLERIAQICRPVSPLTWNKIYDKTSPGSPLRRLAAQQYAWTPLPSDKYAEAAAICNKEMLVDIMTALREAVRFQLSSRESTTTTSL